MRPPTLRHPKRGRKKRKHRIDRWRSGVVSRQFEARAPEANPSLRGQFSWPLLRLLPPRQRFAYYRGGFHSNATIKAAAAPTLLSYLMYILDIKECSLLFYVPSLSRAGCAFRHRTSLLVYYIQPHSRTIQRRMDCCECVARKERKNIYVDARARTQALQGRTGNPGLRGKCLIEMGMISRLFSWKASFEGQCEVLLHWTLNLKDK